MLLLSTHVLTKTTRRRFLGTLGSMGLVVAVAGCGSNQGPSALHPVARPTGVFAPGGSGDLSSTEVLASHTTDSTPTPVPPSPTPTPAPRTMKVWTARSDGPWLQAIRWASNAYHSSHPNVTIDVSGGHEDFGEIVESFGAGLGPDVIEPGNPVPLMTRGMVQPLEKYLHGSAVDPSNYFPAMWANGSWGGKTLGIPALDHGTELGLAWNTSLTATAHAPSSWDELFIFGRQLTQRDASGGLQMLGFDPLDGVGGILDTVRDVTGQEWFDPVTNRVSLDNPSYQAYLEKIVTYYSTIGIEQIVTFRKSNLPLTNRENSAMNMGRQVAILDGYWAVSDLARLGHNHAWQFGYAWVPSLPAGSQIQRLGGCILSIPSVAPLPDDAWRLIETLCSDATNRIMCDQVGTCVMTLSFLKSDAWRRYPGMQFYVDSVRQATRLTSRSNNVVSGFAQEKWVQAVGAVLAGKQSIGDALKAAQSAVQAAANRVQK